uniref:Coatomer subunit delta n=1 Tax=Salix viminalis TaxID=40686 RepID=A0A6N2MPW7_SALVM
MAKSRQHYSTHNASLSPTGVRSREWEGPSRWTEYLGPDLNSPMASRLSRNKVGSDGQVQSLGGGSHKGLNLQWVVQLTEVAEGLMAKMYRLNQILDFPDPVGHFSSLTCGKLVQVDKVALDALNDGAEVRLQSLEPWVQAQEFLINYSIMIPDFIMKCSSIELLLDLMAFREQALRLILDLSSTVITLLPHQNSLILHAFMDLFCSFVRVNLFSEKIETGGNPGVIFKTHPNMNKELFANENILGLRDPTRPLPTGQTGDAGVGILKWRMQSADESMVPLTINCWPSVSGNETFVSIEYEASSLFDLRNVMISVPLPALREPPSVRQIDGEWRYDSRNSILEWSILLIDNSNHSGAMEFVVPPADSSSFFPISVRFSATSTYSELKVVNILPLKGGAPPKFSQRTQLVTENYQDISNHPC